jgi:hypothetical protein
MLTGLTQRLAEQVAPKLFNSVGTELCELVGWVDTPTGYGGTTQTESVKASDIPCVFEPKPLASRFAFGDQKGVQVLMSEIQLPCIWDGNPINPALSDKVRISEGTGANYEREFSIQDISNMHGVYYVLTVTQEQGDA